jgi:hypothetical protein
MRTRTRLGWLLSAALGLACSAPSVDVPAAPSGISVTFEPAALPSAVPAHLRARLHGSAGAEPWLFHGQLSDYYERALRKGEVASAIRTRAVALRFWSEQADLLLEPLNWLDAGEHYTLALLGRGAVDDWDVEAEGAPRAERLFPPAGRPLQRVSVQCSSAFQASLPAVSLKPADVPVTVAFDSPRVADTTCITFLADGDAPEPGVLPPSLAGVSLVPGAFQPAENWPISPAATCAGVPCADACVEVRDDRVLVTAQSHDTLWVVDEPAPQVVVSSAGQRTTLLSGLTPRTPYTLRSSLLSSDGTTRACELELTTASAARHLVLSEVLANPLGPEPASEWIELVNDSQLAVDLAGLWLEDATNRSFLPHDVLAPHERALLVGAGFRPSALDAPVAPGTRLLELSSLGARGLSNSGEALLLVGEEGIVARFPALNASHAGRSQARRALDGADDEPAAFGEHGGVGASPGAPNVFD